MSLHPQQAPSLEGKVTRSRRAPASQATPAKAARSRKAVAGAAATTKVNRARGPAPEKAVKPRLATKATGPARKPAAAKIAEVAAPAPEPMPEPVAVHTTERVGGRVRRSRLSALFAWMRPVRTARRSTPRASQEG